MSVTVVSLTPGGHHGGAGGGGGGGEMRPPLDDKSFPVHWVGGGGEPVGRSGFYFY